MSAALQMASSTTRQLSRNWSLPNILTYARVAAVPLVAGFLFWPRRPWARWTALAIFIAAGISDFFDGYLARAWAQQSSLGRMLDPIADKLLVSAVILVLAANQTISGLTLWAAIVILCRDPGVWVCANTWPSSEFRCRSRLSPSGRRRSNSSPSAS